MNARDWRFPMLCPNCSTEGGTPYRVQTEATTLTLDLRCRDCRHEWQIAAPSPSLFLKAKHDRRKSCRQTPPS